MPRAVVQIGKEIARVSLEALGLTAVERVDVWSGAHRWVPFDGPMEIETSGWSAWCEANYDRVLAAMPRSARDRIAEMDAQHG